MSTIIIAVLIFLALIFLHELGHFLAAKLVGVRVREFAIGMGPAIFKRQKGETLYSLRAFPLGGFCEMGEDEEDDGSSGSFQSKGKLARFFVLSAGALMNLLTGFVILIVLTASGGDIGTTEVHSFKTENAQTAEQGLQVGDEILSINGASMHIANDVVYFLSRFRGQDVEMEVRRDGERITLEGIVFPYTEVARSELTGNEADADKVERLYQTDFYLVAEPPNPFTVVRSAFYQSVAIAKLIWQSLGDLITGYTPITELSGPVGVTDAIGNAAEQGMDQLLFFVVFISINLGVMNLLPIPALDGGRILFLLIEAVIRRPIPPRYEGYVHLAGFVLLIGFSIYITFQDIFRLAQG